MITLSISASSNELDKVLDFTNIGHGIVDCSIEFWMELLDTVQKIFINIVKHAHPTQKGIVKISLSYIRDQNAIEITFIDEGIPYNPLEGLDQSSDTKRADILEGGIRLYLMEKTTEETSYVYVNKKNVTTIMKYLE